MEPPPAVHGGLPELLPKHTIFLSHSGHDKPFVERLCEELERVNHSPFFDQKSESLPKGERFASLIFEAAEQCLLGVVVLSEAYLTSKWPMLELVAFVKASKTRNPNLRIFPLFYKLLPSDLVASKWAESWKEMVGEGKICEEEIELWKDAVRLLRSFNGMEFRKSGTSEGKYIKDVVDEICKIAPPLLRYNTDRIRGYQRICKATSLMFEEGVPEEWVCKPGCWYLGLYGVGGAGKTTLCEAMCSYYQAQFGGRVCHVELRSGSSKGEIDRLKHAVRQLVSFDKRIADNITSKSQGLEILQHQLNNRPPVFLAVDNVGDSQSSRDESLAYVSMGFTCGSKVMVTSRSRLILESILGDAKYCKPIPKLEEGEALELFLSVAAPKTLSSPLRAAESAIVEACLNECKFADDGYETLQYHPLVLRALGAFFHDVDKDDIVGWEEASLAEKKLRGSRESKDVNEILGRNYATLSDELNFFSWIWHSCTKTESLGMNLMYHIFRAMGISFRRYNFCDSCTASNFCISCQDEGKSGILMLVL